MIVRGSWIWFGLLPYFTVYQLVIFQLSPVISFHGELYICCISNDGLRWRLELTWSWRRGSLSLSYFTQRWLSWLLSVLFVHSWLEAHSLFHFFQRFYCLYLCGLKLWSLFPERYFLLIFVFIAVAFLWDLLFSFFFSFYFPPFFFLFPY